MIEELEKTENDMYVCPFCEKTYRKMGISTHIMRMHTDKDKFSNCGIISEGKSRKKINKVNCDICGREIQENMLDFHKKSCKDNKQNEPTACERCGKINNAIYGTGRFCSISCANTRDMSAKTKLKISNSLSGIVRKESRCCLQCKEMFEVTLTENSNFISSRIFCSLKCNYAFPNTKGMQMSAETKNKISLKRKEKFAKGELLNTGGTTKWLDYNNTKVQGTYELRMCSILDRMKELNEILDWEYTNDRVKYINIINEDSTYLLDFKVYRNDKSFYYIETKGYQKDNDLLKWKAARDLGLELVIYFNEDIKNLEKIFLL